MLVLHEGEAGAAEFCDRLHAGGVPVEAQRMRFDIAPSVPLRLFRERRPTIVHTHLIHADLLALPAAAARRVPVRITTKHGFNEFRETGSSRPPIVRPRGSRIDKSRSPVASQPTCPTPRGIPPTPLPSSTTESTPARSRRFRLRRPVSSPSAG